MKRFISLFLCLCLGLAIAYPKYIGDVNNDGSITIADVTQLVNIILGKTTDYNKRLADVNEDGSISISDVTELVNIILGKSEPKELIEADTLFIYYSDNEITYSLPSAWEPYVTVTINDGVVNVNNTNTETEYVTALSGSCSNGSFTYTGSYKTTIVLNGLQLTNSNGAAINIQCSKRIALELADGTNNSIADGGTNNLKGALYCKGHMEVSKGGSLTITGNTKHGITCKEYMLLKKTMGNLTIDGAVGDGIHVEQYFQMNGGNVTVNDVSGDGIQAELKGDESEDDGKIIIKGGILDITLSGNDVSALKSDSLINISDGSITITSTGDDVKAIKSDKDINISGGEFNITQSGGYLVSQITEGNGTTTYDPSYTTALKAVGDINISGGTFIINNTAAGGRGINSDGNINIQGGNLTVNANGEGGILENNGSSTQKSYRVYVAIPTRSNQGGGGYPGGGGSNYWSNVYLYDSSNTLIALLTRQVSLTVNGTTKTFYYYDFGQATSGTYYFKSDDYSSGGGGMGGSTTYAIRSANFTLNLTGEDAFYEISNSYTTNSGTRTFSISNVTSTWSSASSASAEGDTYKAACLKSDGNIVMTDGTLTLSHSGKISKGVKADGDVQIDGGSLSDSAGGGYMVIGTDPAYCTTIKCNNYIGNGGTLSINNTGEASRGISADATLTINDGTYQFKLKGDGSTFMGNGETDGAASVGLKSDGDMTLKGGNITIENTASGGKGIKIGNSSATGANGAKLIIGDKSTTFVGPTLTVNTSGKYLSKSGSGMEEDYIGSTKAIKCMGPIEVYGGNISLSTGSEGAEGLESKHTITFYGGTFESSTYDDAINAASTITFNGANVWAHASDNDAIDSNSSSSQDGIVINGGVVLASSTNSPEEGFDCDNAKFIVNGGVVIGTGGSQGGGGGTPTSASQPYATVSNASLTANTYISIKNSSGTVLSSYKMPRSNNSVTILVSHPQFTSGTSATVVYGSTAISGYTDALWNGAYSTGATSVTGGTSKSITPRM